VVDAEPIGKVKTMWVGSFTKPSVLEAPASCFAKLELCFRDAQSGDREPSGLYYYLNPASPFKEKAYLLEIKNKC